MIFDLVQPMINKMNDDREKVSLINYKYETMEKRVKKVEYLL